MASETGANGLYVTKLIDHRHKTPSTAAPTGLAPLGSKV